MSAFNWVKLHDEFPDHPKVEDLSDEAFRMHVTAICRCNRLLSDGQVTRKGMAKCLPGHPRPEDVAGELVAAGLWQWNDPAERYEINDYLEWQTSKAEIDEKRAAEAERKRKWRQKKASDQAKASHGTDGGTDGGTPAGVPSLEVEVEVEKNLPTRSGSASRSHAEGSGDYIAAALDAYQRNIRNTKPRGGAPAKSSLRADAVRLADRFVLTADELGQVLASRACGEPSPLLASAERREPVR